MFRAMRFPVGEAGEMTEEAAGAIFDLMMTDRHHTWQIVIQRGTDATGGPLPSEGAMDNAMSSIMAWIGTRMLRWANEHPGENLVNCRIEVAVFPGEGINVKGDAKT